MNEIETHLEQLKVYLTGEVKNKLNEERIDYESFCLLTDSELNYLGFKLGERKKILESFKKSNGIKIEIKEFSKLNQTPTPERPIFNKFNNGNPIPGRPIKLLSQENNRVVINVDALEIIKRINGTVAVCSVAGPYRTGKSYILNLLLNRPDGFVLGPDLESCTRGIWMWNTPIKHKNKHGKLHVLFLDTEGINSFDSSSTSDNMIFVISLLLSSLFLYNTFNVIDREAIRKLGVMANLANHINNLASDEENRSNSDRFKSIQMKMNLPDFVWVLRDVYLKNCHDTPNDYLNNALKFEDNKSGDKAIKEVNLIRDSIKKSLKSLNCYLIPAPIEGTNRDECLKNLENVNWEELREEFRYHISALCHHIHENIACKSLFATPLSGPAFAEYIQSIVKQMNKNKQVSLIDSMLASLQNASQLVVDDAIRMYEREMNEYLEVNQMPLEWQKLNMKHDEIYRKSLSYLEKNINGQNDITKNFFDAFSQSICGYEESSDGDGGVKISSGKWSKIRNENSKMIKEYFKTCLDNLWKALIVEKYFSNDATTNNNANLGSDFENSFNRLKEIYQNENKFSDGPEKNESYIEWYIEKDIKNVLLNMKQISDGIRDKIENDRRACEERAVKERNEKETEEALKRREADKKENSEYLKTIQERHENTIRELQVQIEQRNVQAQDDDSDDDFLGVVGDILNGVKDIVTTASDIFTIVKPIFKL